MSASDLRALLDAAQVRRVPLHAPGVLDPVSAALARRAGFEVAYLSGAVASAMVHGRPDLGFVQGGDIADLARRLRSTLGPMPLIADADTGYGNALQVAWTVERYAAAGIAGLHLEDQVSPKRCGHMTGKAVVGMDEAASKIRAACDATTEVVVIARTDARSVEGLDAAVSRAAAYAEAGADLVFVEGVSDQEGLAAVHAALPEVGLVLNRSEAGTLDDLDDTTLGELGVRVVIHPLSAMLAAAKAMEGAYAAIAFGRRADPAAGLTWDELTGLLDLPGLLEAEGRYAT